MDSSALNDKLNVDFGDDDDFFLDDDDLDPAAGFNFAVEQNISSLVTLWKGEKYSFLSLLPTYVICRGEILIPETGKHYRYIEDIGR